MTNYNKQMSKDLESWDNDPVLKTALEEAYFVGGGMVNTILNRSDEQDPKGLDQHSPGAKLDAGKPLAGILADFSLALQEVVKVGTHGAGKYTRGGWKEVENGFERYTDAMWRHLLAESQSEFDNDSGLYHASHLAWNALARLVYKIKMDHQKQCSGKCSCGGKV